MTPFRMNMARGLVLPLGVRKRWHRWLLLYIFIATLVCGTAARQALERVSEWNEMRAKLLKEEFQFQSSRKHGMKNLGVHAFQLAGQFDACVSRLEAINRFQTLGHRTAPLLLGLALPLPPGMELGRFEIGPGGELKFDVHVPADRGVEESLSPARLTALWGKEPLLAGKVESIKTENSERARVGGQSVLNWRFTATMVGEP